MDREALDRYCERGILGLVLVILVFGPLAFGGVRAREFAVIEVLTAGVGLLWAARLWIAKRPQILWPPVCWAVLAFCAYALGRYLTADIEYIARQEFIRVLVYALLLLAILNNLHGQESVTAVSFTVIFLAIGIAGYALYQYLSDSERIWNVVKPSNYAHRGSGTYICPNHLAGFLEMLVPLALAYTVAGRIKKVVPRVLLGYAALAMLAGIAVSGSRGGWLAVGTALCALIGALMLRRQHRLPALALLAVVLAGGALFVTKSYRSQARLQAVVTDEGKVNDGVRFSVWRPAFRMWQDHPWWGVGPGHFDARFPAYRPEGVQLTPDRVHNDYLNTLTDWGIVGFALVLSAWVLLGAGLYRTWRSKRLAPADIGGKATSNKYAFVLGGSIGLLAILVHSAVDFNMHIPANAILATTLIALLSAHLRFATEAYWHRPGAPLKLGLTLLLIVPSAYLLPQAWRGASEFRWRARAALAPSLSNKQVELLKAAHRVEPKNPQTVYLIGEAYRQKSQQGGQFYVDQEGVTYQDLAKEALAWFEKAIKLNPYDARSFSGAGWCLDWLDRTGESAAFFAEAERLDPNNYYNLNRIGLHYIQLNNFAAAKPWFERSLHLQWAENDIPRNYLPIIQTRLIEAATNQIRAKMVVPLN